MSAETLLADLTARERALHTPAVRGDAKRLDALLHDDFMEIGYSGQCHRKHDILTWLPAENTGHAILARHFALSMLGDDLALLTYRSARLDDDACEYRHARRSSLWQRVGENRWQLRFHQATPTDAAPNTPADSCP